jgi:rfaE bifunctional protein nucleotidyltransferase chain/domain
MGKIIKVEQLGNLVKRSKLQGKKIVLVGGVFDLIHRGHIEFLEKAKREGDILIVLLESDEKARKIKGKTRPINNQKDRAFVLSAFRMIDYVISLPYFKEDRDYETLVKTIRPDIIR